MLEADGDDVPPPRDFDAIMADPDLAEDRDGPDDHIRSPPPRSRLFNVSLDLGLLEAIDATARSHRQTRSALLASAARREIVD